MTIPAIKWAFSHRVGSPNRKILLLALAEFADNAGYCWPGQKLLAARVECSIDTIQRQLARLEKAGLLTRRRRRRANGLRSTDGYLLNLSVPGELTSNAQARGENSTPHNIGHAAPVQPPAAASMSGEVMPHMDAVARTTTSNHQLEPKEYQCASRPSPSAPPPDAIAEAFEEFWKVFPSGRKKGKGRALADFRKATAGKGLSGLSATTDELISAAKRYADTKPNPRFVPLPSTWLNGGRWLDPLEPEPEERLHWREEKRRRDAEFMRLVNGTRAP